MKKIIAMLLALAMSATMLAACSGNETTVTDPAQDSTAADTSSTAGEETPAEIQEVELWYYWETEGHQVALRAAIDDYNASQDAYAVTAKYVPFADLKSSSPSALCSRPCPTWSSSTPPTTPPTPPWASSPT